MRSIMDPSNVIVKWSALPTEARYFATAAIVMFAISMLSMLMLYVRRWRMNVRDKLKSEFKFRCQYFIYEALLEKQQEGGPSSELIIRRFGQKELDTPLKKQIMINLLLDLKKSLKGESEKYFSQLYRGLGLYHFSLSKLSSQDHVRRIEGMKELSELTDSCPELERVIIKWQMSSNMMLSDAAKLGALRVGSPLVFSLLEKMETPASEGLLIQLHHQLILMKGDERPQLAEWLKVKNPYGLMLVLWLIAALKQQGALQQVVLLLHHKRDDVKMTALYCLKELHAVEACSTIFHLLDNESEPIKVAAIGAIGKLGKAYHANILRPLLHSNSVKIREATIQAISMIQYNQDTSLGAGMSYNSIKSVK